MKGGNTVTFEYWLELYQKDVYRLCMRLTKNVTEADDLFQETWLRAFKSREKIVTDSGTVKQWLFAICTNIYRDHYMKKKRWLGIMQYFSSHEEKEAYINEVACDKLQTEEIFFKSEEAARLEQAIKQLDDQQRLPIILHFYEGIKYEEMAKILEIPVGTLKYRVHSGKKKLKELLKEGWHE